jgi:tRNA pseudouridine65 synthase
MSYSSSDSIPVLYRDDRIVAVNKPAGIHVHPSAFDRGELSLIDILERQWGVKLFPVHRLDRPTAGVLVFALDSETASWLSAAFRERRVDKTYHAVVRGWMAENTATFDVRLDRQLPETIDAETAFRPLEWYEAPWPRRGFETFRFGLVEAKPVTGRRHQIRQHCDKLRHPILGDTVWGDTGLNGWFAAETARQGFDGTGLHLWCRRLVIPRSDGTSLTVEAQLSSRDADRLEWYGGFSLHEQRLPPNL